jgi:predicted hydrolase (HD superfamily)
VDREQLRTTAEELGVDLDTHIQNVIDGLKPAAPSLGLNRTEPAAVEAD